MNKVIQFPDQELSDEPCKFSEVVCLKCLHRQISVRPVGAPLKVLQCSQCGESGFIIETGEDFDIACTGEDEE